MTPYKGIHYVGDLTCTAIPENLSDIIREIIIEEGLTIVNYCEHKFSPQGITFVFLLAESHLSVHTWPEENKIAVDVYTCNDTGATHNIADKIKEIVGCTEQYEDYISRL